MLLVLAEGAVTVPPPPCRTPRSGVSAPRRTGPVFAPADSDGDFSDDTHSGSTSSAAFADQVSSAYRG
ncbi:hypothetical protein [Kitasatospora sp. NPDC057198]|uniref:hypothetical protein n=1 Tax=Kitasatospora sp. NPDC057198 TaxID=3346046 RepID=UPI00363003F9